MKIPHHGASVSLFRYQVRKMLSETPDPVNVTVDYCMKFLEPLISFWHGAPDLVPQSSGLHNERHLGRRRCRLLHDFLAPGGKRRYRRRHAVHSSPLTNPTFFLHPYKTKFIKGGLSAMQSWRSSMAEQLICNQQVAGSNPIASSKTKKQIKGCFLLPRCDM